MQYTVPTLPRRLAQLLVTCLALAVATTGAAAQDSGASAAETRGELRGEKRLEPCHVPRYRQEVLCGTHRVFEDRDAAAGRAIDIRFAIMPAVGESPQPDPVVVFAGGPGQSAVELAPFLAVAMADVLEQRDLVLIDQRGMGESNPLTCDAPDDPMALDPAELRARSRELLRGCVEAWDADPALYTQDLANADIHEIVGALGYARVNLFGASWGTRSALLYAHRYPEQVRTVTLDGALPPSNTAPLYAGVDGEAALRGLFDDCAADPACARAFPDLAADYDRARARLAASDGGDPVGQRAVTLADPLTGEPIDVVLTPAVFGGLVRSILYSPELGRVLPWLIHRAAEGDYRPLFGVSSYLVSSMGDAMTIGATLAIFCSEELPRSGGAAPDASLIGDDMLATIQDGCALFEQLGVPLAAPAIYGEAMKPSAPALILSGARDPITPPRWGEAMAEVFPDALHLVAPNTGHNVSPVGCAPELIADFIERGELVGLDAECLEEIERPSFFIDASGPAMAGPGGDS